MLTIKENDFLLNGKPFKIYSGAIHYFRHLPEYWEDRLAKLKAAGFNTVETYVPWNLHEPTKGVFDFSRRLDIEKFLGTARDLGLYVILRPGPYICAEWDFGGLPAWLLKDPDMRVRCCYEPYLKHVSDFYAEFLPKIVPNLITNGGGIIAVQAENEYGSYGNDHEYLLFIERLLREHGVDVPLFTSDGSHSDMLSGGTLPHLLKTVNFGSLPRAEFKGLRKFQPKGPLMCMEFWVGWFDFWGNKRHRTRGAANTFSCLKALLNEGASVNIYMFAGGTNFGFTAGANYGKRYSPTITSYDYDALLTEWGGYTKKYHAVRKLLLSVSGQEETPLPPEPKLQTVGRVKLTKTAPLFSNLESIGTTFKSVTAESMEYFGQNHGLILYRHTVTGLYPNASINFDGLADRAYVYLNGAYKGVAYRAANGSVRVGDMKTGDVLDVLTEAMGRINYGTLLHDRKGVKHIRIGGQIISHFEVTTLPLDNIERLAYGENSLAAVPAFFKGEFVATAQDDCFIHLKGFTKGVVYVNGFNLGRFWNIGPQMSLYLPGALLKASNEIVVFELEHCTAAEVDITDKHILAKSKFLKLF
ncbi:MAG: beta-galactosidase [Clostridiaceae bacterium]|jgi:beta-galactosidase|nr:beta-galactosidase [Clostridiaceae bacterium]